MFGKFGLNRCNCKVILTEQKCIIKISDESYLRPLKLYQYH